MTGGGPEVISEITGLPVDRRSEAWRHECECRYVLDAMGNRAQRNLYLYGNVDGKNRDYGSGHANGKHCVAVRRGVEAADRIRTDVMAIIKRRKAEAGQSS